MKVCEDRQHPAGGLVEKALGKHVEVRAAVGARWLCPEIGQQRVVALTAQRHREATSAADDPAWSERHSIQG